MRFLMLAPYYLHWHYSRAVKGVYDITLNIAWFFWHFFSVGILLRTLISPWQRLQEERERGINIESYLSTLIINIVMRLVGVVIRMVFIISGLISIFLVLLSGVVTLILWLILPALIIFLFAIGFILLFKSS